MIFDAVVLAAVIMSAIVAFLRGFIRECLTIAGVGGGLAAAFFGGPAFVPMMRGWLGVKPDDDTPQKLFDIVPMTLVADICAYGLIFVVVVILLSLVSHALAAGAKAIGLGPVDRGLGIAFGAARAVLLLALLYLPVYLLVTKAERDEWFAGSYTRPYVEKVSVWISGYLPKGAAEQTTGAQPAPEDPIEAMSRRLEDVNLLKDTAAQADKALDAVRDAATPPPLQPQGQTPEAGEGYRPEQRESFDQLIEDTQGR